MELGQECTFDLNVSGAFNLEGFEVDKQTGIAYLACASYDRRTWFRCCSTSFLDGQLRWSLVAEARRCYFASFEPYDRKRQQDFAAAAQANGCAELVVLGTTLDGDAVEVLCYPPSAAARLRRASGTSERLTFWFTCRQHPSETQASFFAEGVSAEMARNTELSDSVDTFLVFNANPDGGVRGHTRGNAAGFDLNREWGGRATLSRSPEVVHIQQGMRRTGVDAHVDVHGDESLPHVFSSPRNFHRAKGLTSAQRRLYEAFTESLICESDGVYQMRRGYKESSYLNRNICAMWSCLEFRSLSLTLEMPFKDCAECMDDSHGWTGERSRQLGTVVVRALGSIVSLLRESAGERR